MGLRAAGLGVCTALSACAASATAQSLADAVASNHRVYIPDGSGPFPTVVAIPGCSGVSLDGPATDEGVSGGEGDRLFRRHYPRMAERMRARGFQVVLVDYLTPEGIPNTCGGEISHERVGEYVAASLDFAGGLPNTDGERLFVVGWSHGGAGVIAWLEALGSSTTPAEAAVAVYPECDSRGPWSAPLPVLLVLAGADDIALPEKCEAIAARLPEETDAHLGRYPGARHGFDWTEGPELYEIGDGRTLGRNEAAGKAAWDEIFRFLDSGGRSDSVARA